MKCLFPNLSELLSEEASTRLQLFSEMLLQQKEVVAEDLSNLFSLKEGPDDSQQLAARKKINMSDFDKTHRHFGMTSSYSL